MSSLFGGSKPNTFGNVPSTGFGSSNNSQNTALSGFGTQPLNAAPSLFGANAGSSATGSVGAPNPFGTNATPASNPSPFSQMNNPNSNPGIPSATAPSGNTFSGMNTTAPTSGLFGNNSSGTSLFGNTNANTNANNTTGTGLFGNANQNANTTQTSATGGMFGNPSQSNPAGGGGGLFGNPSGTTASNYTGGGLFSQPNNASGSTTNPGFFGNTNMANNTPNTSFFGGGTTAPLFGQNQQQPTQQTQPPQPATSLFGSSIPNQTVNQSQSLFGPQSSTNKLGSGLLSSTFGSQASPTNLFGPRSSSSLQTPSLSANSQVDIQQRIEAIAAAWDPSSPQCRFQHYFYNLVDPTQVSLYGRPHNATNDALWNQAVRENPDPKCMVPVLALGFDDLQKRVDAQSAQAKQHTEKLKELQTRLTALGQTHVLSTTRNTTRVLQTHTLITHRLLRFVEHIHLLIPNLRSAAISPEEESLRANLERLRDELSSGNGRGRLNELWALLGAVKAAEERGGSEAMEWKVVDWDGLEKLAAILAEQQQGLAHLTSVINNGLKDLQIMGDGAQGTLPESVNSNYLMSSSMLGHSR